MTNSPISPLIHVSTLTRSYGLADASVKALDSIDFVVNRGEFIAILGQSGCGKSTLLSILGLLENFDSGTYELAGADVSTLSFDEKSAIRNKNIGLIFQAFNLIAGMSVLDNVSLPLRYSSTPKNEHRERAMYILEKVGLSNRAQHFPTQLSGGQQQRVAIARAMVTGPGLLLADEPTGNLDSKHSDEIIQIISDFNGLGATVLLVTHDLGVAARARRQVRMADGRFVETNHT